MNTEEIKIKHSKVALVVGIIFIAIAVIVEIAMLTDYIEADSGKIGGFIIASIFTAGILALIGIVALVDFVKNGKRMSDILAKYGEANIIAHIRQNTIGVFQKNQHTDKVYFTDTFVIEPTTAIIHYSEISWMYKHTTRYKNAVRVTIAFVLLDGSKFLLCDYADDQDIASIMRTCQQHNPKIILGYSKEAEEQHNMKVKRFKSGLA